MGIGYGCNLKDMLSAALMQIFLAEFWQSRGSMFEICAMDFDDRDGALGGAISHKNLDETAEKALNPAHFFE